MCFRFWKDVQSRVQLQTDKVGGFSHGREFCNVKFFFFFSVFLTIKNIDKSSATHKKL